jgi:hypothetical protein
VQQQSINVLKQLKIHLLPLESLIAADSDRWVFELLFARSASHCAWGRKYAIPRMVGRVPLIS